MTRHFARPGLKRRRLATTLQLHRAIATDLYMALRTVEWVPGTLYPMCPNCGRGDPENAATPADRRGHDADCAIAQVLTRVDGRPR